MLDSPQGQQTPTNLLAGTQWKLQGFVDVETNILKEPDEDNPYYGAGHTISFTLFFYTDNGNDSLHQVFDGCIPPITGVPIPTNTNFALVTGWSNQSWWGYYVNFSTSTINLLPMFGGSQAMETPDGEFYIGTLYRSVKSFSLIPDKELKLYYEHPVTGKSYYLLFNPFIREVQ